MKKVLGFTVLVGLAVAWAKRAQLSAFGAKPNLFATADEPGSDVSPGHQGPDTY